MPEKMFGARRATKTSKMNKSNMIFTLEAELEEDSSFKDIFTLSNKELLDGNNRAKRSTKISLLVVDFYKLVRQIDE